LSVGVGRSVIALAAEADVHPFAGVGRAPEAQRVAALQDASVREEVGKMHFGPQAGGAGGEERREPT
jgi:hypothetical protein